MAATLRNPRYVRAALASNNFAAHLCNPHYCMDMAFGGNFRIHGSVTELGVVGRYQVRLYDRKTGILIRKIWSSSAGDYSCDCIDYKANGYFVIAFDHGDNPLNAAIADLVTPEPMP